MLIFKLIAFVVKLKGHSQLAHMRIRDHFIANLHIPDSIHTVFNQT